MMDVNGIETVSRDARDAYLKLALATTYIARQLKKPLSQLDLDELVAHLEEIDEAAPFIDVLPRRESSDIVKNGESSKDVLVQEELNGMVVTILQNVVSQVGFLIHNIITGDIEDLENLGLRVDSDGT